ncbi:MAG: hypothetical protein L0Y43_04055, partial [Methylococcaceae bacterium]|nr:hypothetical protein [Methylococcaceae bacterium]
MMTTRLGIASDGKSGGASFDAPNEIIEAKDVDLPGRLSGAAQELVNLLLMQSERLHSILRNICIGD